MATLSFKENALLSLRHQEPEYLPMITDLQTYTPLGMDFVCEYTNVPGEALDWFGQITESMQSHPRQTSGTGYHPMARLYEIP